MGKAAVTYNLENMDDCDFVKKFILETYRQKCRNYITPPLGTFTEFTTQKLRHFKMWLNATKATTFNELINLITAEEFKRLPRNIFMHVEKKGDGAFIIIISSAS